MARFQFNGNQDMFADGVRRYLVAREKFKGEVAVSGFASRATWFELEAAGKGVLACIAVFGKVVE